MVCSRSRAVEGAEEEIPEGPGEVADGAVRPVCGRSQGETTRGLRGPDPGTDDPSTPPQRMRLSRGDLLAPRDEEGQRLAGDISLRVARAAIVGNGKYTHPP